HPRRVHRRRGVQGGARRELPRARRRPRPAGWQRDGRGRRQRAGEREGMSAGRLYGVGVGPGDSELVSVKAARLIGAADVLAYPVARRASSGHGVARTIAAPYVREGVIEVALTYPVTIEPTDHPGGYEAALIEFYDASADELARHL